MGAYWLDLGTISLSYDPMYEQPPALSSLEANWFYTDGTYSITISMDGIGQFTGDDTDGCHYDGRLQLTQPGTNAFLFGFDLTACGTSNGRYDGLATVVDSVVQADTLIASVDNNQLALLFVLSR